MNKFNKILIISLLLLSMISISYNINKPNVGTCVVGIPSICNGNDVRIMPISPIKDVRIMPISPINDVRIMPINNNMI